MPNCPICDTEYVETDRECSTCAWDLTINLQNIRETPKEFGPESENLQNRLCIAIQKVWKKAQTLNNSHSKVSSDLSPENEYLRKTIERVYELEKSDKENNKKIQELETSIKGIKNDIVFFNDLDVDFLRELSQKIPNIEADIINLQSKPSFSKDINQNHSDEIRTISNQKTEKPLTPEENKLIERYGNSPDNSLPNDVIEVNATDESVNNARLGEQKDMFLKQSSRGRGNYWIVKQQGVNYLVPKKNLTLNQHNNITAKALFECREYEQGRFQKFRLLKPAQVSELPEDGKWQLDDKGILEFY